MKTFNVRFILAEGVNRSKTRLLRYTVRGADTAEQATEAAMNKFLELHTLDMLYVPGRYISSLRGKLPVAATEVYPFERFALAA